MSEFHFAEPFWFWLLLVPPVVALWLGRTEGEVDNERVRQYADAGLLAHLLGREGPRKGAKWRQFGRWSLIWVLLVIALAGPRWDYVDVRSMRTRADVLVLLDISRSMNTRDVVPSRLIQARHEVEDLLEHAQGLPVGLIAFASIPHVLAPVTEDLESVRWMLPAIQPDMVELPGSRLKEALNVAGRMLVPGAEGEDRVRAVLVISDGDFHEKGLADAAAELAQDGIHVYTLGVGSRGGGVVVDAQGAPVTDGRGELVRSRLDELQLQEIARAGGGRFLTAESGSADTEAFLAELIAQAGGQEEGEQWARVWLERFWIPLGLAMLLLLPWVSRARLFRRAAA
jgi:Ca-activated chloride channel family protein